MQMSKAPLIAAQVTIVVPVFNRESMIRDCLDSIENQSYTNLKVLVIDDGSTDSTADVVRSYTARDSRFQLIQHEQNTGSMNKAMHDSILSCDTEFFTWIGSDDQYIPSAISQLVAQHRLHRNVDYVSCDLKMIHADSPPCNLCGSAWPNWAGFASLSPLTQFSKKSVAATIYHALCPPFPLNGMWKTDFFRRAKVTWIEYKGNTQSPDTLNLLQFYAHGMTSAHYNEFPLIKYRIHEGQDTVRHAIAAQIRCDLTLLEALFEWFKLEDFLPTSSAKLPKSQAFIDRVKTLVRHRESFHGPSAELSSVLSDIAAEMLLYLWQERSTITEEARSEFTSFFRAYL